MTTQAEIQDFLAQPSLAILGVSRSGKKFGNSILREMKDKGYNINVIHPQAETIEGQPCYCDVQSLPEVPGGVVLVIHPQETEKMVGALADAGVKRVWMQPGSESAKAVELCKQRGVTAITGECMMMHTSQQLAFPHNFHRWVRKVTGGMPK